MTKNLNHRLECQDCGTIYLSMPETITDESPIYCSTCGQFLGKWRDLETDFAEQGGQDGVFKMDEGQITPIAEGRKLSS
jgi:DNA-directed RNA polymerase subunit RPC12/RpoP